MAHDVDAVVGPEGWTTRQRLVGRVDRGTVDAWVATGRLVLLQPGLLATPTGAARWRTRVEALARSRRAVVSHGTALALWDLIPPPAGAVHLTVDCSRSGRGSAGVVLHRAPDVDDVGRRVGAIPVTCVERAIVDAWGASDIPRAVLRGAVIDAVRRRLCTPMDVTFEVRRRSRLPGRARLLELVDLLAAGCRSELEIWGCLHVLRAPGMPPFVQQRRVAVGAERFLLDAAYDEVKLAVELDGAAWHGSADQRERDIRRDALVATIGWQTLRFSYRRLTSRPEECRRDVLAAYDARRRLFGVR